MTEEKINVSTESMTIHDPNSWNNPLDPCPLLSLPLEIRLQIYEKLTPPDRKAIRLVDSQLCNEIDQCIGAVDRIWLKKHKSYETETTQDILEFLQSSTFTALGIDVPFVGIPFSDVITHPFNIKSIDFNTRGVLSPDFANSMLSKCINIRDLTWKGLVNGNLQLPAAAPITFPNLQKISIDTLPSALSKTFLSPRHLDTCWRNQIALMGKIIGPQVTSMDIRLISLVRGNSNELTLTNATIGFLSRQPNAETVEVTFRKIPTSTIANPPGALELLATLVQFPPAEQALKLKRLTVNSSVTTYKVISPWLVFIKGLKHLTHLTLNHNQEITWNPYRDMLITQSNTLVSLNISGKFHESINLQFLQYFKSLKILQIRNRSGDDPSPIIQQFGPHSTIESNLEVLIIDSFCLLRMDLEAISRFKKLKHLAIDGNYEFGTADGISMSTFKQFLTKIRTLESILVDVASLLVASIANDEFIDEAARLLSALNPFMKAGLLVDISDPENCPYWKILDVEPIPNSFLSGFEAVFFLQ